MAIIQCCVCKKILRITNKDDSITSHTYCYSCEKIALFRLYHPTISKKICSMICFVFGHITKSIGSKCIGEFAKGYGREHIKLPVIRNICDRCEKEIVSIDGNKWT